MGFGPLKPMRRRQYVRSWGLLDPPNLIEAYCLLRFRGFEMQLIQSQQITMSSREIAELTGKEHSNVMRDFRRMMADLGKDPFNNESIFRDSYGRKQIEYRLDQELTYCLLAGYSAPLRMAVIQRWQELEGQAAAPAFAIPTTLSGALRLAAEQAETIEAQQLQIEQQKPAVEFVDSYVQADGLMGFRQVAKLLGANERKFRQMLLDESVMYYLGGTLTPMAPHINAGRFEVKTGEADNGHAFTAAKFTPKGVEYVSRLWRAAND
ncbi:antirepressor protein [Pseudomonas phage vB_PcuM_ KLEP17-4]|nr:antirepressor protein [Pseudomonas phage vB_PcuM_ KLEP17-4]